MPAGARNCPALRTFLLRFARMTRFSEVQGDLSVTACPQTCSAGNLWAQALRTYHVCAVHSRRSAITRVKLDNLKRKAHIWSSWNLFREGKLNKWLTELQVLLNVFLHKALTNWSAHLRYPAWKKLVGLIFRSQECASWAGQCFNTPRLCSAAPPGKSSLSPACKGCSFQNPGSRVSLKAGSWVKITKKLCQSLSLTRKPWLEQKLSSPFDPVKIVGLCPVAAWAKGSKVPWALQTCISPAVAGMQQAKIFLGEKDFPCRLEK